MARDSFTAVPTGFSVLICSHNGAQRLPTTLAHIASQHLPYGYDVEVILIDNASTDNTAAVASETWPAETAILLRVLHEPRLGKAYALRTGVENASFGYLVLVDDDNWLRPDYFEVAAEILARNPEVGVIGGQSESAYECEPPDWFVRHSASFAIGPQGRKEADITNERGWVWGAGSIYRREAMDDLERHAITLVMISRAGHRMTTGDDVEMCLYLREIGWRVWYSPRLRIGHYIPRTRFDRRKFRELAFQNGVLRATVRYPLMFDHSRLNTGVRVVLSFLRRHLIRWPDQDSVLELFYLAGELSALIFKGKRIATVKSNRLKLAEARKLKQQVPAHVVTGLSD